MKINTKRLAVCCLLFTLAAGCGNTRATANYQLSPIPGVGSEPSWWVAITTQDGPSRVDSGHKQRRTFKVTVPADVLFDEGQSSLTTTADGAMRTIAHDIRQRHGTDITVTGFTDHFGTAASNDALGQQRADAVAKFLRNAGLKNVKPGTRGERGALCREIRPNGSDDADCRARDRRVVITYTITEALAH
jgi:outer membrane protein OmpA-like peptidoglycan-associated protein